MIAIMVRWIGEPSRTMQLVAAAQNSFGCDQTEIKERHDLFSVNIMMVYEQNIARYTEQIVLVTY
jgi:hypothetical protein